MHDIPLTLNQIRYILAAAGEGSTSAAARRLNISQPSISLAVARAEEALGFPLFVRRPGLGLEPTPQGARKLAELRAAFRQMSGVFSGPDAGGALQEELALGYMTTLGPRYVPKLVRRMMDAHPGCTLTLHEGDLQSLKTWLETGRIDLAVVYDFALPSAFDITVLQEIRPYGLVWPGHALAGRSEVSVQDLLNDPLILINLPSSREYFLSLLPGGQARARIAFETGSVEFLRSAVANRLGVGLLATDLPFDHTYDGNRVVRVPLAGEVPPHRIALARNPGISQTRAVQEFTRICRAELAD